MAKILYVEDNEMNRDMLSRRLQRREHEVLLAVDGKEGLEKIKSERPDIVLMDMGLPVMDGWEATTNAKSDDEITPETFFSTTSNERLIVLNCQLLPEVLTRNSELILFSYSSSTNCPSVSRILR